MISDRETDAALLERFARRRDEAAFGTLVARHGPTVLRACRGVLKCEQDVEDVFQATFVVLAHKAGAVRWDGSVGGWLHSAARRLALHARARTSARRHRERPLSLAREGDRHPSCDPDPEIERRDLRRILDRALEQLPEKYRDPVVLCYLEGKTNEEAARQLGWPAGSMSRRLERARSLLRRRLGEAALLGTLTLLAAAILLTRPGRFDGNVRHREPRVQVVMQAMGSQRDLVTTVLGRAGVENVALSPADREQLAAFARSSEEVAQSIGDQAPAENRLPWLLQTARLRLAAGELDRASRRDDRTAVLAAVRRLDLTCVRCHEVFRQ